MRIFISIILPVLITQFNVSFGQETEKQSAPDTVIAVDIEATRASDTVINEKTGLKPEPETVIYDEPEVFAEFPGGHSAMQQYLAENVRYPEEALRNKESGKLFLQFVVEITGEITNIRVLRSVSPSIDAEGIRLVESFPNWKPAEHSGEKVRSTVNIPINFRLHD